MNTKVPRYLQSLETILGGIPEALREPTPLIIGAYQALAPRLVEAGLDNQGAAKLARKVLARHCNRHSYIREVATEGAMRVDLDGTPVAPVSEEHRQEACRTLLAIGNLELAREYREVRQGKERAQAKPIGKPAGSTAVVAGAPRPVLGLKSRG